MTTLKTAKQLAEANLINTDEIQKLEKVIEKFSVSLTPSLVKLMQTGQAKEAIQKQFLPSEKELIEKPGESKDPIGDNLYTKSKGLIHRYPDRCLLMPITLCPAYCRFCFRREKVGMKNKALSKAELNAAYDYIIQHEEIWEVILTGGDPFILKPKTLREIILALDKIKHV